ncbi:MULTISPECIES: helix-turn-helix domain-containing protein [Bacillus cereus group]|uniref:Transcriptional regulator n=1 Tax=Bacillus thuringiensis serovar mexicanensis TaxID=180868 RepID=A0A2C9YEU0_BACTU|nr:MULTISPECIES: helix-turn-helix transcriptional regulator [Bacillus cereus group]EEM56758.1 Transcriptional activator [Bacillus thuringiensis serovar monterrey BGSC 4AJ1]MEB9674048.1 helix-turn-helix transcriptional regulator [Bacillus anthracis]OTW52665.1 transcriptional regulator [Bacillus thuringiensis serovar mexicanensis]OTX09971.1 transcriptional regulator [Bacillus thuringiensis serovar monterrey]
MKKGSAIKYARRCAGLKQREVYERNNFTSSSLYSRIENNFNDIAEEQYDYFLNLLNVDFETFLQREKQLEAKLHTFFQSIHYLELDKAKEQMNEFENCDTKEFIFHSELNLLYEIYKYYYFIQTRDFDNASLSWNIIGCLKKDALLRETTIADFFHGIHLTYVNEIIKAEDIFSKILTNPTLKSFVDYGDLLFYSCRTKLRLGNYYEAILLGLDAFAYFNSELNYKRSVGISIQLATCYIAINNIKRAEEFVENILRNNLITFILPNHIPVVYHLKGEVHRHKGEFNVAIEWYKKSIEAARSKDPKCIFMKENLSSLYKYLNHTHNEKSLYNLVEVPTKHKNIEHEIIGQFYFLLMHNVDEAVSFIESKIG